MLRKFLPLLLCLGPLTTSLGERPAFAQKAPKGRALETWRKSLESGDETRMMGTLEEISQTREAKAAALLEILLGRGASAGVSRKALEVAGQLGQGSSSSAILPYLNHRSSELRRAALDALTQTRGSAALSAIRALLHGPDAELRGPSARALGRLGARDALPDLFTALPKGVPEAATSIGELCTLEDCQRFATLIGKLPFDTLQSGIEPMLFRPLRDVPEDFKVTVIERLRGLQTKSAGEFLNQILDKWPKDGSAKVRASLEAAVEAMQGAIR